MISEKKIQKDKSKRYFKELFSGHTEIERWKSIYDQLLALLDEKDIDIDKINDFIKKKIKESKKKLNDAKNGEEADAIKIIIEEWKQFLSD